jgi:hypothetical protein
MRPQDSRSSIPGGRRSPLRRRRSIPHRSTATPRRKDRSCCRSLRRRHRRSHRRLPIRLGSIVVLSAILPSPNRICKMSDNTHYVNHIHLHAQTIPPIPRGKQAHFCGGRRHGIAHPWPRFRVPPVRHHSGLGGSA